MAYHGDIPQLDLQATTTSAQTPRSNSRLCAGHALYGGVHGDKCSPCCRKMPVSKLWQPFPILNANNQHLPCRYALLSPPTYKDAKSALQHVLLLRLSCQHSYAGCCNQWHICSGMFTKLQLQHLAMTPTQLRHIKALPPSRSNLEAALTVQSKACQAASATAMPQHQLQPALTPNGSQNSD